MSSPSLCEKRMNLGSDVNATTTYGSKGWVLSKRERNCFTRRVWFLNAMTVRHCAQLTLSHGIQIKNYNCNNNLRIENMNIDKQKMRLLLSRMQRYIIVSMFLNLDTFYYLFRKLLTSLAAQTLLQIKIYATIHKIECGLHMIDMRFQSIA